MHLSKNISHGLLALAAIIFSRLIFTLIDDPEGPNLLIVVVLAVIIYLILLMLSQLVSSIKKP